MSVSYILPTIVSDQAAVVASDSSGGAGPGNVSKPRPSLYWKSQFTNSTLQRNYTVPTPVDTLVFGWVNGRSGDTFRLRADDVEANLTVSPAYDSNDLHPGGVPVWPSGSDLTPYESHHRHFELDDTYTLKYWRLDFNFGGNPDGYIKLSRWVTGLRIEPQYPVLYPVSAGVSEPVTENVDFGGEESPRPRGTKRSVGALFGWSRKAEWVSMYRLLLQHGSSRDVVLVLDKDEDVAHMEVTYVGRVKDPQPSQVLGHNRFSLSFAVSEMGVIPMALV